MHQRLPEPPEPEPALQDVPMLEEESAEEGEEMSLQYS